MTVILLPNLCSEMVQGLAWNVGRPNLQSIEPKHQLIALLGRKGENAFF